MDEANTHLLDEDIDDLELESEPEPEPGNGKKNAGSNSSSVQSSKQHYSWFIPFCVNIFLSCASFSIIQPSLAPYLLQTGIPESFLPWVLFSYSIGGMIGAPAVGLLYQYASQMFEMEGRGAKICLLVCPLFGLIGSALYAIAGWMEDVNVARWFILFGRFLQGTWKGGQQTVEQGERIHNSVFL